MTIDDFSRAVPVIDPEIWKVQIIHMGNSSGQNGDKPYLIPIGVRFNGKSARHDLSNSGPDSACLVDFYACSCAAHVFRYSRHENLEGFDQMEVERAVTIAIEDGAITALDGEVLCACLGPAATLGELRPHLRSMIAARKAEALGLVVVGGVHIDTDGIRRMPNPLRIVSTDTKKRDTTEDRKRQTVLLSVARLPDAGISPLWDWLHARGWLE